MLIDTKTATDPDCPEWTKEKFDRSLSFSELPPAFPQALKRGKRGPQKAVKTEAASADDIKPNC